MKKLILIILVLSNCNVRAQHYLITKKVDFRKTPDLAGELIDIIPANTILAYQDTNTDVGEWRAVYYDRNGLSVGYVLKKYVKVLSEEEGDKLIDKQRAYNKRNNPVKFEDYHKIPDDIGTPIINMTLDNLTDETIIGIDVEIDCYDVMGRPVDYLFSFTNKAVFAIATHIDPCPGSEEIRFLLEADGGTQTEKVKIKSVRYKSGQIVHLQKPIRWIPDKNEN